MLTIDVIADSNGRTFTIGAHGGQAPYHVDHGDGYTDQLADDTARVSHTYAANGDYTVAVMSLVDSEQATTTVTVTGVSFVPTWITPDEVAARLDGTVDLADERLVGAVYAVAALVESRHSSVDFSDPANVPVNFHEGAVQWAALMYQQRNAPSGFPGFGDVGDGFSMGAVYGQDAQKWSEIMRLLAWRKPVIA